MCKSFFVFLIIFWIPDNVRFNKPVYSNKYKYYLPIYPEILEKVEADEVSFFSPLELPQ